MSAGVHVLLQRLEGVGQNGKGWRARCPACGGAKRKLSINEVEDRVLVYCFAGCRGDEVLAAVGLRWGDLMPPRTWPESHAEQGKVRRAIRESGWSSALSVLCVESHVTLFAARDIAAGRLLNTVDEERLATAVKRIEHASSILAGDWRG